MEHWQLFIDESGAHKTRSVPNVVTGLLLREVDSLDNRKALVSAIQRALPLVPYPPHATDLNQDASRIAYHALALGQRRVLEPDERAAAVPCSAAWNVIQRTDADALRSFKAALASSSLPDHDALEACSNWLQVHMPTLRGPLTALRQQQRQNMTGLCQQLGQVYGASGCFVVAAANCSPTGDEQTDPETDLYLELLDAVLERVVALLRSADGTQRVVQVWVAGRRVRQGRWPRPLQAPTIATATERAMAYPVLPPARPEIKAPFRFVVQAPQDANRAPQTHPGLVLADFISNRLFGALNSATLWHALREQSRARFALPVEAYFRALNQNAGFDALPTVASDGPPRTAVRKAFEGAQPLPALGHVQPDWAREQAERWLEAAAALQTQEHPGGNQ